VVFLSAALAPSVLAASAIDGPEDFVPIARNGFALVVDGDFFGGDGYPNLVLHPLGSPRNSYPWSMAWFEDQLYVGTIRDVLCFSGQDVGACLPNDDGTISIGPEQRPEIWRYTPSVVDYGLSGSWERVYQSPFVGFPLSMFTPDLPRDRGYRAMAVCDAGGTERLYVAATGAPGRILYYDGADFRPASSSGLRASLLDLRNGTADIGYRGLLCFKGRLWTTPAGSATDVDASFHPVVLMNPDPAGGAPWQTVVDASTHPTLGDPDNIGVFQIEAIGDSLFASVGNRVTGFELWKGDGSACSAPPGPCPISWTKIIDNGGERPADGYEPLVDNAGATLGVFRDQLYVAPAESGFFAPTLAELMRVREDDTWELLVGWPRADFATIENMHCPFPVDLPIDDDDAADDCYPTSLRGPGFGSNPFSPGAASYFWRFVEHEDTFFVGTLDVLLDQDGFDFYRSDDGVQWTTVVTDGFGRASNYGVRTFASVPGLGLVVGVANPFTTLPGGVEIWVGTTAPGAETPPIVFAGDDALVVDWDRDGVVQHELDGSGSIDPLGGTGIVLYEWFAGTLEDLGGDCGGIAAAPFSTDPAVPLVLASSDPDTGAEVLIYPFTLRVEDAGGNTACDDVTITASYNLPPSAVITPSVPLAPPAGYDATPDVRLADFDGDGIERYEIDGLCTDPEEDIVSCRWYLRDPGNTLSDLSECSNVHRCELHSSVETVVPSNPVLADLGITRPDVFLQVVDGAGLTAYARFEGRVEEVIDTEADDAPACSSSTFTMMWGVDEELVIDPTAEPRLCIDPDDDDVEITYELRVDERYPAAAHGTVTDGDLLTYTPDPGFTGTDVFYFQGVDPGPGEAVKSWTAGVRVHVLEDPEDSTPPQVEVGFPVAGASYGPLAFFLGCRTPSLDLCGSASDTETGVESVAVSLRRDADGAYWNGDSFTASAEPVVLAADGTTDWRLPVGLLPAGSYTVSVSATDLYGNECAPVTVPFTRTGIRGLAGRSAGRR
jgi:hypothetical protein